VNAKFIRIVAPPAPQCFSTRDVWVEHLISAEQAFVGKKPVRVDGRNTARPFIDGKYNPHYQFCRDCTAKHAHEMTLAGKCAFKAYVASLLPAEPTKEGACSSST
jgi:hypothetical protein